jgi:hypothetical protein
MTSTAAWLEERELPLYAEAFAEQAIEVGVISDLTESRKARHPTKPIGALAGAGHLLKGLLALWGQAT